MGGRVPGFGSHEGFTMVRPVPAAEEPKARGGEGCPTEPHPQIHGMESRRRNNNVHFTKTLNQTLSDGENVLQKSERILHETSSNCSFYA